MSTNFFHRVPVGLVGTETNREPMDGEPRQKSRTTKASAMHRLCTGWRPTQPTASNQRINRQTSDASSAHPPPPPHSTPLLVRR